VARATRVSRRLTCASLRTHKRSTAQHPRTAGGRPAPQADSSRVLVGYCLVSWLGACVCVCVRACARACARVGSWIGPRNSPFCSAEDSSVFPITCSLPITAHLALSLRARHTLPLAQPAGPRLFCSPSPWRWPPSRSPICNPECATKRLAMRRLLSSALLRCVCVCVCVCVFQSASVVCGRVFLCALSM
jgi:hypothetical protein